VDGVWRGISEPPFVIITPISYGTDFVNVVFQPYGGKSGPVQKSENTLNVRAAFRYDLVIEYSGMDEFPPGEVPKAPTASAPMRFTTSMWTDQANGTLIRYVGEGLYGTTGKALTVDVSPLTSEPRINVPSVGKAAFEGSPPPWRTVVIGTSKLSRLKSYSFTRKDGVEAFRIEVRGQVSETQGRLAGTVPDFLVYEDLPESEAPDAPHLVDAELIYVDGKMWVRIENGKWRRFATGGMGSLSDSDLALTLTYFVPSGPVAEVSPLAIVGMSGNISIFGVGDIGSSFTSQPKLVATDFVGEEQVNGVRTLHYRGGSKESGSGDVWLAADGHHIVRLKIRSSSQWIGQGEILGNSDSQYDITDANKPFTVKPPQP